MFFIYVTLKTHWRLQTRCFLLKRNLPYQNSALQPNRFFVCKYYSDIFLTLSTPCIIAHNHFFLFQINEYNMSVTHIYHHLPPTCFGVCYTFFRGTIALLAQKLRAFCNVAIICTIYPDILNLQCCYSVYNTVYYVLLHLKDLKNVS